MKKRCGAIGIIREIDGAIFVEVQTVLRDLNYKGMKLRLSADLKVSDLLPAQRLYVERRGLALLVDNSNLVFDEGEIVANKKERGRLDFVSDYDEGMSPTPVRNLVGKRVIVKWEFYNDWGLRKSALPII